MDICKKKKRREEKNTVKITIEKFSKLIFHFATSDS